MLDAASLFGRSVSPHHGAVALWAASGVVASSTSSGARADALARLLHVCNSGRVRVKRLVARLGCMLYVTRPLIEHAPLAPIFWLAQLARDVARSAAARAGTLANTL